MRLGYIICPHCAQIHPTTEAVCSATGRPLPRSLHKDAPPVRAAKSAARRTNPGDAGLLGGRYRVQQRIGRGGVADVYRGEDTSSGVAVAIKVMRGDFLAKLRPQDREPHVQRVLQEATVTSAIGHPNIRSVFDSGRLPDGSAYLVMELLQGTSLDQHLRTAGSLVVGAALDIVSQVLSGLDAAHENRILHRDIKPGNIFLAGSVTAPQVKLLDFGFAKLMHGAAVMTRRSVRLGTRGYMSPEQLMGDPLDGRSDLFTTGLVLYEMLTGRRPFPVDGDLPRRLMHEQPRPLASYDVRLAPLDTVLGRALAKPPAQRYPTARAFQRDAMALRSHPVASLRCLARTSVPSVESLGLEDDNDMATTTVRTDALPGSVKPASSSSSRGRRG